jgi:putative heme iron utilization protein
VATTAAAVTRVAAALEALRAEAAMAKVRRGALAPTVAVSRVASSMGASRANMASVGPMEPATVLSEAVAVMTEVVAWGMETMVVELTVVGAVVVAHWVEPVAMAASGWRRHHRGLERS